MMRRTSCWALAVRAVLSQQKQNFDPGLSKELRASKQNDWPLLANEESPYHDHGDRYVGSSIQVVSRYDRTEGCVNGTPTKPSLCTEYSPHLARQPPSSLLRARAPHDSPKLTDCSRPQSSDKSQSRAAPARCDCLRGKAPQRSGYARHRPSTEMAPYPPVNLAGGAKIGGSLNKYVGRGGAVVGWLFLR